MVQLSTLRYLSRQKLRDSFTLLRNRRHAAAVYIAGYALEMELKRKLSLTLGFNRGFPDTMFDFNSYANEIAAINQNSGIQLNQLREIRNHDLKKLLIYSGAELRIIASFYNEWVEVNDWNPEDRYRIRRISQSNANGFVRSIRVLLAQIS